MRHRSAASAALTAVIFATAGCAGGTSQSPGPAAAAPLTDGDARTLAAMREEEKLARDVYRALTAHDPLFDHIAWSEQRHLDAVGRLLQRYGLADPVADDTSGRFPSPEVQALHDRLVSAGRASPAAAYRVALEIEELDLRDLTQARAEVRDPEIGRVYENLSRATRNHLRHFWSRIQTGETYTPQFLDPVTFHEIAGGALERGPGPGGGLGPGAGPGRGPGAGRGPGHGRGQGRGRGQGGPGPHGDCDMSCPFRPDA